MPKVTVIVPCYRYGRYVTGCVTSLLSNTAVDLDILVVDDASPDDSWSVVQRLPELDPRVRVQRNEVNRGLIATANAAIEAATGDYVVLLSADDAHARGWLDRAVAHLEANPAAVLAYGPTRRFTGELPQVRRRRVRATVYRGHDWLTQRCAAGCAVLFSPEAVVRTSAQHAVGGYRSDLPYSSDMEMWMRLATVGDVVAVGGPVAAFYRIGQDSMSGVARVNLINQLLFDRAAFQAWWSFAEGRVPDRDLLLARAYRALARRAIKRTVAAFVLDPRSEDVDQLCTFAAQCDAQRAGSQAAQFRWWGKRRTLRGLIRLCRPAARAAVRAYWRYDDLRFRLQAR